MASKKSKPGDGKKALSARIPESLYARIEAVAEQNPEFGNVTAAAIHLLRRGLAAEEERPATAADMAALRQQMAGMAEQLTRVVREQPVQIAAGSLPASAEELAAARLEERERIAALSPLRRLFGRLGD